MDNQILSLYAKGMTTREIAAAFKELYDADISPALVHNQRCRVAEQCDPECHQKAEGVPDGRVSEKGGVAGNLGSITEMEDAA